MLVKNWLAGCYSTKLVVMGLLALQWYPGLFNSPKNLKLHFWDDLKEHFVRKINTTPELSVFPRCRFSKNKKFGEKIEKTKIGSKNFKL